MTKRTSCALIDWREVGIDLRRHGYGPSRVSVAMGRPTSTVQMWFQHGSEPGFSDGHRLLSLWATVVRKERPAPELQLNITFQRHKGNALAAI